MSTAIYAPPETMIVNLICITLIKMVHQILSKISCATLRIVAATTAAAVRHAAILRRIRPAT